MSSHLTVEVMNGYARRSLPPGELLSADDHLEACAACRERISDDEGLREAIRALQQALQPSTDAEDRHLGYRQIEIHAEGILGRADREIIEAHLATCETCAAEARDLAAFVRSARATIGASASLPAGGETRPSEATLRAAPEVNAPPEPRPEPLSGAPATEAGQEEAVPEPEAARIPPRPAMLAILATGLVAAAAAALLITWTMRRKVADLTAQVAALQSTNEALSLQANMAQTLRAELEAVRSAPADPPPAGPGTAGPEIGVPSAAITLVDRRGPVGLDANGDLIGLDALSVAAGRTIAAALRSGHPGTPEELQDLLVAPAAPGGEAAGAVARPLAPVATIVRDPRPTFSWRALPGASSYTVAISDAESNAVARSESLTRASWRLSRPLKRGGLYSWRVIARRNGEEVASIEPPGPEARFKVLGAAESAALERSLRDAGGSHLAAGVLLARAGCIAEARKEFQELLRKNPDSPLARDLLKSVTSGPEAADGAEAP